MRFIVFTFGVVTMVFLVCAFCAGFRKAFIWKHEAAREYAVTGHNVIRKLLIPIICTITFIVLVLLVRFPFVIPTYFFPEANRLFHLSHYLNVFVNGFINRNIAVCLYIESVYYYGI